MPILATSRLPSALLGDDPSQGQAASALLGSPLGPQIMAMLGGGGAPIPDQAPPAMPSPDVMPHSMSSAPPAAASDDPAAPASTTPAPAGGLPSGSAASGLPMLPPIPQIQKGGEVGNILDSLFTKGAFRRNREANYNADVANYQQQMGRLQYQRDLALARGATGKDATWASADPTGYLDTLKARSAPAVVKAGETRDLGDGTDYTAPVVGFDAEGGGGYRVDGNTGALTTAGTTLPGKVEISSAGIINNSRTGPQGTFSLPQPIAPGSSPASFTPTVSGASGTAPASPVITPALPLAAALAGAKGARGVRNNNPGNVKPSPTGKWQGQVGVDPAGYVQFDTPQNGARAADLNLEAYAGHGITTPDALVERWASTSPPKEKAAYKARITAAVGPKFDLTNQATRAAIMPAMMASEGTTALSKGAAAAVAKLPAAPPGWAVGGAPKTASAPYQVPGTDEIVQTGPDGLTHSVAKSAWGAEQALSLRKGVMDDPAFRAANESGAAYQSMLSLAKQKPGGMRAYALRDTFARTINPGAVARAGTIEAIKGSQGVPANVQAYLMNLKGDGDVPPEMVQQLLSAARPFAQSHWDQAQALNDGNIALAGRHGMNPDDVTAPLDARPGAPQVGAVEKGYRFKGGDPRKASSWQRAQ